MIHRQYVAVGTRRVRYVRAGSGAPVLVIYPNAAVLDEVIAFLAKKYTVFAFDNPGYIGSDPLEQEEISIADLADALAACLRAMDFPPLPVFGTHTGAAIAIELAVRHPELVTGLVLDGVPLFTPDEVAAHESMGYFYELKPDPLGGHFTSIWTKTRDWLAFDPWCAREAPARRPEGEAADPLAVHQEMLTFLLYARHYLKPYKAAFRFGSVGAARLAALRTKAVFTVDEGDTLIEHIGRFPAPNQDQTLVVRKGGTPALLELLASTLPAYALPAPPPADPKPAPDAAGISKNFVTTGTGQLLLRRCGASHAPALVILHDAPGSSWRIEGLITELARDYHVTAFDLPGCGESDPLPGPQPTVQDFAAAISEALDALDMSAVTLYGIGFGSSVALEIAVNFSMRISSLHIRGLLLPYAAERQEMLAQYAPPIVIDDIGSGWYRTWLMLRDSLITWPWYRRGPGSVRSGNADFSADALHDWTLDVMRQHASYHHVIHAALRHDAEESLRALTLPVEIHDDPDHPFAVYQNRLRQIHLDAR